MKQKRFYHKEDIDNVGNRVVKTNWNAVAAVLTAVAVLIGSLTTAFNSCHTSKKDMPRHKIERRR